MAVEREATDIPVISLLAGGQTHVRRIVGARFFRHVL
jgi:hypothetical protein